MARFGAVITAMVTPFHDDYTLDLDGAQALASHLLDNGSDGLVVTGSTGEAPTLRHREKLDLYRAVVDVAKGRGTVIAGTGTYDTEETIELTREAEEAGVDAALVVTPYYSRPPQRGLIAHFTKVADSTGLPILLYNIPSRTATLIEADTLLRLAEVENIVGVKDATADFQAASRIIADAPAGFEVYSGDDWATFPFVCLGGVGVVSVAAHLVGDRMNEMIRLCKSGDVSAAWKIHSSLLPLYKALFVTSNPIPVKAALEISGRPAGPPRLPLVPATPEERELLTRVMGDLGLV
ncbi:MAG TPA: 4-hydroxy-tetrahydrodipicolinate synthase [Actinomycetota bacterium]